MVNEARNEVLVINDSDVRVEQTTCAPSWLPSAIPKSVAVTCLYVFTHDKNVHAASPVHRHDFRFLSWNLSRPPARWHKVRARANHRHNPGATWLDSAAYEAIENRPADDLLVAA